jgi:WD40 repeat protein
MIFSFPSRSSGVETHPDIHGNKTIVHAYRPLFLIILVSAFFAVGARGKDVISKLVTIPIPVRDDAKFIWALDFSPDGNQIAIGSLFHVEVWDWKNNRRIADLPLPQGLAPQPGGHGIKYSPDGSLLVLAIAGNPRGHELRVFHTIDWSIATEIVDEKPGVVSSFAFSPDGQVLYAASQLIGEGKALTAYQVGNWRPIWNFDIGKLTPIAVSVSPDGRQLAIAGSLFVLPTNATDLSEKIRQLKEISQLIVVDTRTHIARQAVNTEAWGPMSWSVDSNRLVMNGGAHYELFDVPGNRSVAQISEPGTGHTDIALSPDGKWLMESDADALGSGLGLSIWNPTRQHLERKVSGNIWCLAISHDSKLLATAGDNATTIWKIVD